jgi:hypothetical protein
MSEAAPAFIPRRGFVKHARLSIDSAALFASAYLASQMFSRNFLTIQNESSNRNNRLAAFLIRSGHPKLHST